jgi:UDP-sugar pyrophosphorylase
MLFFFFGYRHTSDPTKSLTINVEYNQLDPLLRNQGDRKGDVADPETGYSPFPGNANNLVIELGAYSKTLRGEDQGVVLEFVNPKYKDDTRTDFKKPTRLECMMQDIPKLFQKEMKDSVNIGFTLFDRWFTFSPAKVKKICCIVLIREETTPTNIADVRLSMVVELARFRH